MIALSQDFPPGRLRQKFEMSFGIDDCAEIISYCTKGLYFVQYDCICVYPSFVFRAPSGVKGSPGVPDQESIVDKISDIW